MGHLRIDTAYGLPICINFMKGQNQNFTYYVGCISKNVRCPKQQSQFLWHDCRHLSVGLISNLFFLILSDILFLRDKLSGHGLVSKVKFSTFFSKKKIKFSLKGVFSYKNSKVKVGQKKTLTKNNREVKLKTHV